MAGSVPGSTPSGWSRRATVLHEKDEPIGWCIVMRDPEGNEFCVT